MRGIPYKVRVVVGDPLPLYRLEILKKLVRKTALRKLEEIRNSVRDAV